MSREAIQQSLKVRNHLSIFAFWIGVYGRKHAVAQDDVCPVLQVDGGSGNAVPLFLVDRDVHIAYDVPYRRAVHRQVPSVIIAAANALTDGEEILVLAMKMSTFFNVQMVEKPQNQGLWRSGSAVKGRKHIQPVQDIGFCIVSLVGKVVLKTSTIYPVVRKLKNKIF